jgi:hypothetical protein
MVTTLMIFGILELALPRGALVFFVSEVGFGNASAYPCTGNAQGTKMG